MGSLVTARKAHHCVSMEGGWCWAKGWLDSEGSTRLARGDSRRLQERGYKIRLNPSPLGVLALAVAVFVAACATPAPTDELLLEARATVQSDVATEEPPSEPAEPAPSAPAGDAELLISYEASLASEEIADPLRQRRGLGPGRLTV